MSFMLVSHSSHHLQFASDEGHRFRFDVVTSFGARRIDVGDITWTSGCRPHNCDEFIESASMFALVCAQDYGLM